LLLFTLKNLLMTIYVFKKHEIFLKTMKIVAFFLITYMGKMARAGAGAAKNGPAPQHWR
jgi:hypothetical protein